VPAASAACDGHECDPHESDWGCAGDDVEPSDECCAQGVMVDSDHWATTLPNADWLNFYSYDTIRLHYSAWTGKRQPDEGLSSIWIAPAAPEGPPAPFPDAYPADAADGGVDNTTLASGNLGEFDKLGPGEAWVENATCSPTIVRVVIGFPHLEGGVPPEYIGPCQKRAVSPVGGGG
jgi:hypothetical protein